MELYHFSFRIESRGQLVQFIRGIIFADRPGRYSTRMLQYAAL